MKHASFFVLFQLALAAVSAPITIADELPDVYPIISGLIVASGSTVNQSEIDEGCAGALHRRRLLRFDQFTWNNGPADLVLGAPDCPDCTTHPHEICGNPLYTCSVATGKAYAHVRGFANYTVRRKNDLSVVARGHKQGFCLEDERCNDGVTAHNPDDTPQTVCNYLTAGCVDAYPSDHGCQYVDITGLPAGDYVLEVILNKERIFKEANYDNNTSKVPFKIGKVSSQITVKISAPAQGSGEKTANIQATVPLMRNRPLNPMTVPVHIVISAEAAALINLIIPATIPGAGCSAADGWTKISRNSWKYVNQSGFIGAGCTDTSQGVQQLVLTLSKDGGNATLKLVAQLPADMVITTPRAMVARLIQDENSASNDTFSAADTSHCAMNSRNVITCK